MRREAHSGFGERSGETDRQQCQHRAPGRLSLTVFADHGACGAGEALGIILRPGNAGPNTAAGHIEAARLALAQLPRRLRRRALIRTDSGGGTPEFLAWLASPGRRLHYSVGMTVTEDVAEAILQLPDRVWKPAYDGDGQARPGTWVAEITGLLDLAAWPEGMGIIVRKERPHPGAQLRFTEPQPTINCRNAKSARGEHGCGAMNQSSLQRKRMHEKA